MPTITYTNQATQIWPEWVTITYANTTSTCTDVTWNVWATNTDSNTAVTYTGITWGGWAEDYAETQEQAKARKEAQEARYKEQRKKEEEYALQRKKSRETAKALLVMLLDAVQKEQLEKKKYFDVISKKGRKYRIREGIAGNIKLVKEDGREPLQFCIHPNNVPEEDAMLAQKLMIETDEDAFLRTANLTSHMSDSEAEEIMREARNLRRIPA